jgi:hypothetical protein
MYIYIYIYIFLYEPKANITNINNYFIHMTHIWHFILLAFQLLWVLKCFTKIKIKN